jgi:tetratricopeptide (TPR) repeat protein
LRDYTEALACFDRIPNKLSTLGIIEEWKGRALLALERYAEAGTYLENSVKARPNDAELWHNLARARYMLGDYAAAEVALMKALAVHGDTPKLLGFLAACQLALSKPQKALDASDRGLSLEPADLMCMRCRGSALGVLGRYAEAVTAFDRLLGLAPDDDSTHFLRALSLANLGRLPEALASIEKAIALADSETRYRLLRAELTLAVHGWDAALAALYEALCRAGADDNARLASSFAKLLAFAFNDTAPRDVLRTRLSGLLVAATTVRPLPDVKQSPELPAALATALIRHIPAVLSDQIGDAKASLWLDTWKEVAGARPEFAIALRILGAAVLCRDLTKRPRAKLELPKEERQILVELLNEAFPPPA